MYWIRYERGGLIQQAENTRSAWEVYLPDYGDLHFGRVESYWRGDALRWRSYDHWYCQHQEGLPTRQAAALGLLTGCARTRELLQRRGVGARLQPDGAGANPAPG